MHLRDHVNDKINHCYTTVLSLTNSSYNRNYTKIELKNLQMTNVIKLGSPPLISSYSSK